MAPVVAKTLTAEPGSIRIARLLAAEAARSVAADDGTLADIELVTSELATNAIEHGSGTSFGVVIEAAPDCVRITVASTSDGHRAPSIIDAPGLGTSGRGLRIASSVADSLSIAHDATNVSVTCTFRITPRALEPEDRASV